MFGNNWFEFGMKGVPFELFPPTYFQSEIREIEICLCPGPSAPNCPMFQCFGAEFLLLYERFVAFGSEFRTDLRLCPSISARPVPKFCHASMFLYRWYSKGTLRVFQRYSKGTPRVPNGVPRAVSYTHLTLPTIYSV